MLRLAEQKVGEISSFQNVSDQIANHARGVTFLEGDIRKLPFAHRAFDGVLCLAVLLHLKPVDQDAALVEFARVLTPRGLLLVSVKSGRGVARRHDAGGWRLAFLQSPKAFQTRIENAGFRVLKLELHDEWIEVLAEKR